MSSTHKEVLASANAAIAAGDFDGFLAHCTDDTEWTFEGDRTLTGKAAVRQWMLSTYNKPPNFRVDRMIAEGDYVVAVGEIALTDEAGNAADFVYCDVWRFRDGQMAELRAFVVKRA